MSPPASGAADAVFIKICINIYIYHIPSVESQAEAVLHICTGGDGIVLETFYMGLELCFIFIFMRLLLFSSTGVNAAF